MKAQTQEVQSSKFKVQVLGAVLLLTTACFHLHAGVTRGTTYKTAEPADNDTVIKASERLSWETDLVDWAFLMPNAGLEIDLGDPLKVSSPSLLLNLRYSLNSKVDFPMLNVGMEYRRHFRVSDPPQQRKGLARPFGAIVDWLRGAERTKASRQKAQESSVKGHPEWIKGRAYAGLWADYMTYGVDSPLDMYGDEDKIADKGSVAFGLSFGNDFPAYNFNNRYFLQFQAGMKLGALYTQMEKWRPAVALRAALAFRKTDIRRKYWTMRQEIIEVNITRNKEMSRQADSIRENFSLNTNIFVEVDELDKDGNIKSPVTKRQVISEIERQTGYEMDPDRFFEYTEGLFPIKKLDEYSIGYHIVRGQETFTQEATTEDVTIRFRVQMSGRGAALVKKNKLVAAIRKYRDEHGGSVPVIYGRDAKNSGDRTKFENPIRRRDIVKLFTDIQGEQLDPNLFKEFWIRKAQGVYEPVKDEDMNKPTLYSVNIEWHPQVKLNYDEDDVLALFRADFRFDKFGRDLYDRLNGQEVAFSEKWDGNQERLAKRKVTADDIAAQIKAKGINGVTSDMIKVPQTDRLVLNKKYPAKVNLVAGYQATVLYSVQDGESERLAKAAQKDIIAPWIAAKQYPQITAKRGEDGNFDIDRQQVIDAFSKSVGYSFTPAQFVDWGDEQPTVMPDGRLRKTVKIQLHFTTPIMTIPYYIIEQE